MSLVAEFELGSPILRASFERVPEARLSWVRSDVDAMTNELVGWLDGVDAGRFLDAAAADPTVDDAERLTSVGERALLEAALTERGREVSIYPVMTEAGAVVSELTGTADGWTGRVILPDRETLVGVREACQQRGVSLAVTRLFTEDGHDAETPWGLTQPQREALLAAVETGYLSVPREANLGDLAAALGVSRNAASERFRRGTRTLVDHTLRRPDELDPI